MASTSSPALTKASAVVQEPRKDDEEVLEKPYSVWNHPHLTWKDAMASYLLRLMLPFEKLTKTDPNSEQGLEANQKLRVTFDKFMHMKFKSEVAAWSNKVGGLAQCVWTVPSNASILHEWNIISKNDKLLEQVPSSYELKVHVWCPVSLLDGIQVDEDTQKNDCGCIEVDTMDLKSLPKQVPLVVWFHGGGLTFGGSECPGIACKINQLLDKQTGSDVIVASVDYRLSPEHKLPAASIDALSVVNYVIQMDPDRKIHLAGESAGAYLATVAAFAAHSQYPNHIKSALLHIPFLNPAADTKSYYMNGPGSVFIPVSWLRWSWCAAMGINYHQSTGNTKKDVKKQATAVTADEMLALNSNRSALNASPYKANEAWHRFLEPLQGVPNDLGGSNENATKYIVGMSKADPLYDDGVELVQRLTNSGANLTIVESLGSHGFGFECDPAARNAVIEAWRGEIFDTAE